MSFDTIFKYGRVAGIAGNRNTGKTNNIISMVLDFRKRNTTTKIYTYGLPLYVNNYLKEYNVEVIDSIKQIATKRDCILILDEFQKLKLGDRRYKDILEELMAMIYHPTSNNYVLFCSPTTREYTSVMGAHIEVWLLKAMHISDTVNGSQLKKALENYRGHYYKLGYYDIPKGKMILLNDECEKVLDCKYIPDVDVKVNIKNILLPDTKLSDKLSTKKSRNCRRKR